MYIKQKILNAFTLAEILLVFFIIGIVAAITIPNAVGKIEGTVNADMTYSAFNAIQTAITEDYLKNSTVFDSTAKVCSALTKYLNTTKYDCSNKTITLANGIAVKDISASTPITITVDIDGARRKGTEADGDIVKFIVTTDNVVLPTGTNAVKKEYLSGKYGIDNNGTYTWVEKNISYKDAICKSGNMVGISNCSTYCGSANYCAVNGSSVHASCRTGNCETFLIKPSHLK